jgi:bifunctional DNase/RNase
MDFIKTENIKGIIQDISLSNNFEEEYDEIDTVCLFHYERLDNTYSFGVVMSFTGDEYKNICVNVPLSLRSFLVFKHIGDNNCFNNNTIYTLINVFSNEFEISVVCAIVTDVIEDYFKTSIIIGKDDKFSVVDLPLSDVFNLKNTMSFPIFINKEIINKRKIDKATIMSYLSQDSGETT